MQPDETISHYRIVRKLGGGGMGVVYEAEDLNLQRRVALKFLPDYLKNDEDALARFRREARAASATSHPSICVIYEIAEHQGDPFIAMELLKGRTLRQIINEKPLDLDQVVEFGMQIADALDVAHSQGIIHRDIKPANIFITERGLAKLLDFGLAKQAANLPSAPDADTVELDQQLTSAGSVMGTVAYMSPEQARGKEIDARSDLFSFGAVLYEMVTGAHAFEGESMGEIMESIFIRQPLPVGQRSPSVPSEFERIVRKALEKEPVLRYQSASEMRADLQRLKHESTAHVSLSGTVRVSAAAPSVAVLPFMDLSAARDQEYFSDGLAEEVLNNLAQIPELRVVARTSSFQFKGKNEDLRTIGQKLNAVTILEGSVRKEANRVRISVQLINSADAISLWSQSYNRELEDIFGVQEEIARSVASALKVTLLGEKTAAVRPRNSDAYTSYLQGRYFYERRTQRDLEASVRYFEAAIRSDPEYAPAWAGLAAARISQTDNVFLPAEAGYRSAQEAAERALSLNSNLAEAHAVMGWIKMLRDWDWPGADAAFKQARDLEPANVVVLRRAASLAATLGRFDEAIQLTLRAAELDPLIPATHFNLGSFYWYAGRLNDTVAAFQKALELNPDLPGRHSLLGQVYLQQGHLSEAMAEIEHEQDPFWRHMGMALALHAQGKKEDADRKFQEFVEDYKDDSAFQIAQVHAVRGELDLAFEWLDRAYERRDSGLALIKGDPLLKNLEPDPRYAAFLAKLRLP